jgi:hypothetical protein
VLTNRTSVIGQTQSHGNFMKALITEHVTVGSFGVIGSYFSEEDGQAVTVNSGRCVHMLHNFLAPEINRHGINQQTMWIQQDRATAYTARVSTTVVREMFLGISFLSTVIFHGLLGHLT